MISPTDRATRWGNRRDDRVSYGCKFEMTIVVVSCLANSAGKRVVLLITLIRIHAEIVLAYYRVDALEELLLHLFVAILWCNTVVYAQGDNLWHGVDLLASADDVDGLRCLDGELCAWVETDELGGQLVQVILLE
ncbi:hypothetical protein HG531_003611 [Fusarium graminearum]|nr:hypothetical protein HG531_003611 [Fusarium graminearum]